VRDEIVHVTGASSPYYIYKYEASRVDASAGSAGAQQTRACSRSPVLPWASVTYTQAANACQAAGMRLCRTTRSGGCGQGTVTNDEWGVACLNGQICSSGTYPYSCTYSSSSCNGAEKIINAATTTGSPSTCVTVNDLDSGTSGTQQLFDMSGNVAEWTEDCRGTLSDGRAIYTVRGGAYNSFESALRCEFMVAQLALNFSHPDTGFRCCSSCAAGLADCSGTCVNLATSSTNCGACGTTCGGGSTCVNGTCE
jgi:hypothetical protein